MSGVLDGPDGVRKDIPSVGDVMSRFAWRPIRGCAGRYVLVTPRPEVGPSELLAAAVLVRRCWSTATRDAVLLVRLRGGGLITYVRADGSCHPTLADESGWWRKLDGLGLGDGAVSRRG